MNVAIGFTTVLALAIGLSDSTSQPSSAAVLDRSNAATQALLEGIEPDSTFHQSKAVYERPRAAQVPGPFELPESYQQDVWAYFDSNGVLAQIWVEVRDPSTGTVLQTSHLRGPDVVITDAIFGETTIVSDYELTVEELASRITGAVAKTSELENATGASRSVQINGGAFYVLEDRASDSGYTRYTIDSATYLPSRVEQFTLDSTGAEVLERSTTFEAFESLSGNRLPATSN